ncbi:Vacuolar protein sorting-associated protein Ist1 [Sesbania bispinosa]|nr:Vacuolar protein sorting-associated protein Ist1 [Sesbania bispinosa]
MFSNLFGWPKASTCKKVIKRARCRLSRLKNKRQAIATQLRKDLADLIQNGHQQTALKRVEQLIQDESLVVAYELLDHFFEFILAKLSYIRRHKDCPTDINEAVSSIVFASARCGDFPELYTIRKLFGQRYGKEFATAAVELFPGNLVNIKLKENLSVNSVPDDLKYRVVDEIARDNGLQPKMKEYEGNQLVESEAQMNDTINAGSKIHPSEVEEIETDATCANLSIIEPSDDFSLSESTLNDTFALVSTVQHYPPCLSSPLQTEVEKVEDFPEPSLFETSDLQNKGEIIALSSSERLSLVPYAEVMVDYVDDIEGCQFVVSKDGSCGQDQRLLFDCDESDKDQDESNSEKSSIRSSTKSKRASKKRLRRRSASLESQGIMDIGYMIYYQKPCRSSPSTQKHGTQYHRQQKKPLLEGIQQSSYPKKRQKQHTTSSEKEKCIWSCENFNMSDCSCSLDQPCYCYVYNDLECWEDLSMKPKKRTGFSQIQQGVLLGEFCNSHDESNKGMELVTIPHNDDIEADTSKSLGSSTSTNASNSKACDSLTLTETATPYSKALIMAPEWSKNCKDNSLRTYSCPYEQPKHVHPKLPDYDDMVATFTAFKRECALRMQ